MKEEKNIPLVSIIMGVYNEEKYIEKCLVSIINQTYTNWEFIICDDCSTDNTVNILKNYEEIDKRISVIKNKTNQRLASSLNRCLKKANGKYIARMDADDESLPTRLQEQVDFLETHEDIDVVGCNRMIFDDNGEYGIRGSIEKPTKDILLKRTPFAHPTIMMKKTVYDQLGGYTVSKKTMRSEDLDLWIRFYSHGFKGYNIQKVLYRYREGKQDLKKRTLSAAIQTSKVYFQGYKILNIPFYKRIWGIKPIIAALIPNVIMNVYYKMSLRG